VYACVPGCVTAGLEFPSWCRDLPDRGARFAPGDPLCTVHAAAADSARAAALVWRRHAMLTRALIRAAA